MRSYAERNTGMRNPSVRESSVCPSVQLPLALCYCVSHRLKSFKTQVGPLQRSISPV